MDEREFIITGEITELKQTFINIKIKINMDCQKNSQTKSQTRLLRFMFR